MGGYAKGGAMNLGTSDLIGIAIAVALWVIFLFGIDVV